ncbi:MAG: LacI family DNA-binding transcriptional regulator [Actinomycetota bacterium]|nr:LacI family DNA-binding transcriptional regulator [Actinomycetota bacterium]
MTSVTIRDVAHEAGVSVATVSRALRGLPSVAPATREKVEAVAARLDYVPDPYAAHLSSTGGHTIIVAVPLPGQWYYAQVVESVEAVASAAGYDIQLHVAGDDQQRRRLVEDVLPRSRRVDGVILVDIPIEAAEVKVLLDRGVRMIAVGQPTEGVVTVAVDNVQAAREATSHLIKLGHRRIGMLGGMPDGPTRLSIPGEREAGFRQAIQDAGLEVDDSLVFNANFSIGGGADATRELLKMENPPTALFCLSDEMAAGAMQAARELGVDVPGVLAIMGFDDHDFAEAMGLSTVHQPVFEQGEVAVQALLDAVEGRPYDGDRVLPHKLILRNTTETRGSR